MVILISDKVYFQAKKNYHGQRESLYNKEWSVHNNKNVYEYNNRASKYIKQNLVEPQEANDIYTI